MRRLFLVLIFLIPALAGAVDRYHLVRVLVTGSERYHEDDLVRATGLKVDSQVTADDLQNAANRLGNSGAFSSVEFLFKPAIGTKGVEADFQVADAEKFLPAAFENFVWFNESELQEAVHQAVPLYNGQLPTSGNMSDEVSAALVKLLASKGLPSDVSYMLAAEFGQLPSVYKFKVANANVKIKDVSVSGAAHMLPELLAKSIAPLKNAAYLRSDVLKVLEKNLVPLYRQHGYLKFAISEVKPKLEENELVHVEVSVNEGEQYRLGGYAWSGNTLVTSEELSKRISLKAGEPLNALQLERDLAQAKKLFGKFGREGVIIDAVPAFSAGAVAYSFQVKEGELYHMGKLEIEGIDPEQIRKLTQGWKLGEGEPYDNTYIHQFLEHTVLKVPGHKWEWMTFEQIDDTQKTVNVRLQVKIE
ncbi:MAG TPA: POTRA domain-containing protein [Candidatus Angelobacter sp.]|nr:POTRA domain-containing protein [Candidatus Angelobacter sp.]